MRRAWRWLRDTVDELVDLWRIIGEVQRSFADIDRNKDLW
jgi:hypothetical protein